MATETIALETITKQLDEKKIALNNMEDEKWEELLKAAKAQVESQKYHDERLANAEDKDTGILSQIKNAIKEFIDMIFGEEYIDITGDVLPTVGENKGYTFNLKSAQEVSFQLEKYMTENPEQKIIYYSFEEKNANGAVSTYVLKNGEAQKTENNLYQGEIDTEKDLNARITFVNRFDGVEPPKPIEPPVEPETPIVPDPIPGGGGNSTTPPTTPTTEITDEPVPAGPAPEEIVIEEEAIPEGPAPEEIIIEEDEIPMGPSVLPNTGGIGALLLCGLGTGIAAMGVALRRRAK